MTHDKKSASSGTAVDTKRRTLLMAAASGAAVLAAPAIHAQQQKTIRFLNGEPSRDSVQALRNAADEYEKKTGVKVIIDTVPADDSFGKLQAAISSGNSYDIGTLAFAGHVLILAEAGKLVPITSLVNRHKWGPRITYPINNED